MFSKLGEAVDLFVNHFGLIAAVVLTVWLPGNLLVNSIAYFTPAPGNESGAFLASMFVEGLFDPICIGALIYALWEIKQGERVGFGEAIRVGVQNWGRLFAARLVAGLQIMLGLIAFVIPGVMLALRYAFLDCVVTIEGAGSGESRWRSTRLTEGIRAQIFVMSALFYFASIVAAWMIYMLLFLAEDVGQFSLPAAIVLQVAADCALDLVSAVLQIAIFLYYWDRRVEEMGDEPPTPHDAELEDDFADVSRRLGEIEDDGNPYRSPQSGQLSGIPSTARPILL